MKVSFIEEFLRKLRQDKNNQRLFVGVVSVLAILVFFSTYMLISPDAITIDSEQVETLAQTQTEQTSEVETQTTTEQTTQETSQVTTTKTQSANSLDLDSGISTLSEDSVGADFGEYISTVTYEIIVDDEFVEVDENYVFEDGDVVRFTISYEIPTGYLDGTNTISYQLPLGISLLEPQDGAVYKNGVAYGYHYIDINGLITIIFYDSFDYENSFQGNIQFEGELEGSEDGSALDIEFVAGGPGITITGDESVTQEDESGTSSEESTSNSGGSGSTGGDGSDDTTSGDGSGGTTGDGSGDDSSNPDSSNPDSSNPDSSNTTNEDSTGNTDESQTSSTSTTQGTTAAPNYNMWGSKTQSSSSDSDSISYTLTIATGNGTGSTISVYDTFNTSEAGYENGQYDIDSFEIVLYYNYNTIIETLDASEYVFLLTAEDGTSYFVINELPALDAGYQYKIYYTATPSGASAETADGSTIIQNDVEVFSGSNSFTATVKTTAKDAIFSKNGVYNSTTQEITWLIALNPDGRNLDGFTLSDEMTSSEGETYIIETAQLTDSTTDETIEISLPYTFDDSFDSSHDYVISYVTDANEIGVYNKTIKFNNTVTLSNDETTYTTSSNEVSYKITTYELDKISTDADKSTGIYAWQSTISIPDLDGEVAEDLTYTDTISNLEFGGQILESHYITLGELKEISITVDGKSVDSSNYTLSCANQWGTTISTTSADDTVINIFSLTFTSEFISSISSKDIVITYETTLDLEAGSEGISYTIKNSANVGDLSSAVEIPYKKGSSISKTLTDYIDGEMLQYEDIYDEDIGAAIVEYQIFFDFTFYEEDYSNLPEQIIDTLPENCELLEDSVSAVFYVSAYYQPTNIWLSGTQFFAVDFFDVVATGNIIEFNIDSSMTQYSNDFTGFIITYQVKLSSPEQWNGVIEQEFVNSATCGADEDVAKIIVESTDAYLDKTGEQVTNTDSLGNEISTNYAAFSVIINKSAISLSDSATNVVLIDTMDLVTTSSSVTAQVDTTSVQLYDYDSEAQDGKGELIDRTEYKFMTYENDDGTYSIELELPDERALVLEYQYKIDFGTYAGTSVGVINAVEIAGLDAVSEESQINMVRTSSSANVVQKSLTIYKYEKYNQGIALAGATFYFEKYKDGEWVDTVIGTQTTDENGFIYLELYSMYDEFEEARGNYETDVVYKMTEIEAPEGYMLNADPYYFVWVGDGESAEDSAATISSEDYIDQKPDDLYLKDINFVLNDETIVPISNEANELEVTKQWVDDNYSTIIPNIDEVTIELYRAQSQLVESYTVTVTSTSNGTKSDGTAELDIVKTIEVAAGSPLTIAVFNSAETNQVFSIDGGEAGIVKSPDSEYTNIVAYSIDSVTSDMQITITTEELIGMSYDFYFFDFEEASYESVGVGELVGEYTLTRENDWSLSWEFYDGESTDPMVLPMHDEDDEPYFYCVKEIVPSGFIVSYSDNNEEGVISGELIITNQMIGYTLPSTGSISSLMYKVIGTLLIFVSMTIILYKKLKERGFITRLNMRFLN